MKKLIISLCFFLILFCGCKASSPDNFALMYDNSHDPYGISVHGDDVQLDNYKSYLLLDRKELENNKTYQNILEEIHTIINISKQEIGSEEAQKMRLEAEQFLSLNINDGESLYNLYNNGLFNFFDKDMHTYKIDATTAQTLINKFIDYYDILFKDLNQ